MLTKYKVYLFGDCHDPGSAPGSRNDRGKKWMPDPTYSQCAIDRQVRHDKTKKTQWGRCHYREIACPRHAALSSGKDRPPRNDRRRRRGNCNLPLYQPLMRLDDLILLHLHLSAVVGEEAVDLHFHIGEFGVDGGGEAGFDEGGEFFFQQVEVFFGKGFLGFDGAVTEQALELPGMFGQQQAVAADLRKGDGAVLFQGGQFQAALVNMPAFQVAGALIPPAAGGINRAGGVVLPQPLGGGG